MRLAQISHLVLHPTESGTRSIKDYFQTLLAGLIGAVFGLLMGMTALAALMGSQAATEIGKPGMLLIKVIVVGTFVILSVILFTHLFTDEEEEEEK